MEVESKKCLGVGGVQREVFLNLIVSTVQVEVCVWVVDVVSCFRWFPGWRLSPGRGGIPGESDV